MLKVKITYPHPVEELQKQLPGKGFSNISFSINPPEDNTRYDYWIVYNHLRGRISGKNKKETTICPKENTIFIAPEGHHIQSYFTRFCNQFAVIFTCQEEIAARHPAAILHPPFTAWFVKKTYDELLNNDIVEKNKMISIITSNKVFTVGHRKRLDFVYALKKHFKDKIDLFGRGIKDFDDKWGVIAPYKYSVAIENAFSPDYFTEKLFDCYLSLTFPIYYGCPNVEDYFNDKSFARIDIDDLGESIKVIEKIIEDETQYDHAFPELLKAKAATLSNQNIFNYLTRFIEEREAGNSIAKEYLPVKIRQTFYDPSTLIEKMKDKRNRKNS
jgi:hypothetical protein